MPPCRKLHQKVTCMDASTSHRQIVDFPYPKIWQFSTVGRSFPLSISLNSETVTPGCLCPKKEHIRELGVIKLSDF